MGLPMKLRGEVHRQELVASSKGFVTEMDAGIDIRRAAKGAIDADGAGSKNDTVTVVIIASNSEWVIPAGPSSQPKVVRPRC